MQEYTKNVKRQIRELAGLLYERELNEEISKLDEHFEVWRKGELSPFDLAERIHHFHQHPARELYVRFTHPGFEDVLVAQGIASGRLKEEEVPPEVAEAFAGRVAFLRSNQ